jgi:hypothetical protein
MKPWHSVATGGENGNIEGMAEIVAGMGDFVKAEWNGKALSKIMSGRG